MTANDQPIETPADTAQPVEAGAAPPPAMTTTAAGSDQAAEIGPPAGRGDRIGALAREAAAAGERFGREAQAAGERFGRDPALVGAADWASRAWGLIVLAVGLWFLADVTLGLDMPGFAWRELWPIVLIVVGLAVVLRGLARRA